MQSYAPTMETIIPCHRKDSRTRRRISYSDGSMVLDNPIRRRTVAEAVLQRAHQMAGHARIASCPRWDQRTGSYRYEPAAACVEVSDLIRNQFARRTVHYQRRSKKVVGYHSVDVGEQAEVCLDRARRRLLADHREVLDH